MATLHKRVQERLPYHKLFESCAVQGEPNFLNWRQVTIDLLQCEREVGELVQLEGWGATACGGSIYASAAYKTVDPVGRTGSNAHLEK